MESSGWYTTNAIHIMKLIVGLGNPGEEYKNNRHNIGFLVLDKLKIKISNSKLLISKQIKIFKSKNFMNNSGETVKKLVNDLAMKQYNNLYIVHDDLDLALGSWKINFAKGPKDHNGINDIEQKLQSKDFWRIRVGIENRNKAAGPEGHLPESETLRSRRLARRGEDYVLQDFKEDELPILNKVIGEIVKELEKRMKNNGKD